MSLDGVDIAEINLIIISDNAKNVQFIKIW